MAHAKTCLSVVVASLLVFEAFLQGTEPMAGASHDQVPHDTVALTTSQDLLAADPRAIARFLETARPVPVSAELKARALTTLPLEGAVLDLNASARQKLAALSTLLRATMMARSAEAIAEVPVELDLRVIAHATLDAADLERTSDTVQSLLASAGVPSRWRDCGVGCSADPGSVAIDVLLLPMTKLTGSDVCGEVTRDARTGVRTVLIYMPPIAERVLTIRRRADGRSNPALATMQTGHLVGAAIAHEVGHALGLRHGARGVMKARLTLDDALALRTSRLVFTSSESASMRSALRTAGNSVVAAAR